MAFSVPQGPLVPRGRLADSLPTAPDDVWAEVLAAAELHETLQRAGRQVRFGLDEAGRVDVCVCDLSGRVLRRVGLTTAVDPRALERAALSQGD